MNNIHRAFELFDAHNQQDPKVVTWEGISYPAEYFYALQLHHWVIQLEPSPSAPLLLASRSQHIGRWSVPRETYPAGKAGYLNWRTDLSRFHADKAGELMREAGIDKETILATQRIIRKENLRTNPEVQVIESALCLVFLQFQYEEFISEHEDDKVIRILKKSWAKMNEDGRRAAASLSFSERGNELLQKALAS